jgi:hypothetical protein
VLFFQILSDVKCSIALFEDCRGSPACLDTVSIKMQMSMEHGWNDTDRGKNELFGTKLVTLRLCPPQIPDILMKGKALTS